MATSVMLNSAVESGIDERLATLGRDDDIVVSEHVQDRERLRQREVVREVRILGLRLESSDSDDDCG